MKHLSIFVFILLSAHSFAQQNAANIFHNLQKLKNSGTVLYIAAHPDDENTRLLAWLANEKKMRTAYLSLTRGDGGQNLIGKEQGVPLGIIRTHELLQARKIDGAEQFFSSAYDFGYSKSPEEALKIWGEAAVLEDVVRVVRLLQPDWIVTRFPTTGEGGHGHHTASAILAQEAFAAAADASKFPNAGPVWQAKALYWNAFNFGSNNTTREDMVKVDIGQYNKTLGTSYGEMAAASRSQHKSQGFGVPMQRGQSIEYFKPLLGDTTAPIFLLPTDLTGKMDMDLDMVLAKFNLQNPATSIEALLKFRDIYEKQLSPYKLNLVNDVLFDLSGVFMEALAEKQLNALGQNLSLQYFFNNRNGLPVSNVGFKFLGRSVELQMADANKTSNAKDSILLTDAAMVSQPLWLKEKMLSGRFTNDGFAPNNKDLAPLQVEVIFDLYGKKLTKKIPLQFKQVDPVKGELMHNVVVTYPLLVSVVQDVVLLDENKPTTKKADLLLQANVAIDDVVEIDASEASVGKVFAGHLKLAVGETVNIPIEIKSSALKGAVTNISFLVKWRNDAYGQALQKIAYDHIPEVQFHYSDQLRVLKSDIKIAGANAGYIEGSGDKIPDALKQLGYKVTTLHEDDIMAERLNQFDVVVLGVRAFNTQTWLQGKQPMLMDYVANGGTLLVQYNTNNQLGKLQFPIGPYPFTISRTRVTDESAAPVFLKKDHPIFDVPNKISENDFEGWVQERSIYQAEKVDEKYDDLLSFADPAEKPTSGSLISVDFGKGRFVYAGLAFFRQLPAGVPGAYRLFANIVANRKYVNAK